MLSIRRTRSARGNTTRKKVPQRKKVELGRHLGQNIRSAYASTLDDSVPAEMGQLLKRLDAVTRRGR